MGEKNEGRRERIIVFDAHEIGGRVFLPASEVERIVGTLNSVSDAWDACSGCAGESLTVEMNMQIAKVRAIREGLGRAISEPISVMPKG